ncbi:excinuclease ABC subunit UvrA [Micromonospora ureilytica]|uniref:excinuclease ABC subunit UvrA n=1 Tax=Micromonospora ureilytica TaxID=709868 RepID=UPI0033E338F0
MELHDHITVAGARENNLRDITLRVPKRKITVFTGVSGSGKSSLVFDTIAAEAQRQLNETFTAFVRNWLPSYGQPDVDGIDNLSAAIIVDQKRLGGNRRSTVGTASDIAPLLRLLFSRAGTPSLNSPNVFSPNDPQGMCPSCTGLGHRVALDLDAFLDRSRSLDEGALLHPEFAVGTFYWKVYARSGLLDSSRKLAEYTSEEWQTLLHGEPTPIAVGRQASEANARYEGVVDKFDRLFIKKDGAMADRTREVYERFVTTATCAECNGARLNPTVLSCRVIGYSIAELSAMEAGRLVGVLDEITGPTAAPVVRSLRERIGNLVHIGLDYLSLDRLTTTLSGGESQRIKMVRHLNSSLIDMLYVFDEPSIGLHPRDVYRLNDLLVRLRDKGNTVLVVEHDPDLIAIADHVVDMGPRAGVHGGRVVFEGTCEELRRADTLTGRFLRDRPAVRRDARRPTGYLPITDATANNLQKISVDIPTGVLTVVTGVAGSGKSSLVNDVFLGRHPEAIVIDQAAVAASRRSNPATYTGIMDGIRRLFAKANGVSASLFSFNSAGACPACQGLGVVYTDLAFLDMLKTTCEACHGRRFSDQVLEHRLRGMSISDVLDLSAAEARDFFTERKIRDVLQAVTDVGLDYLRLGQPLSTLSGGECQRIKLATELHKDGALYVLDEPTTGMHMSDVGQLLRIFDRLVDRGNTVVVVEHNLEVIGHADWIIDLGPEGGSRGGQVLFEGTPRHLLAVDHSHTAVALRRNLEA